MAPRSSQIEALYPARLDRVRQRPVRRVDLGDDQEPGGIAIKSMHNPRTGPTPDTLDVGDMPEKRVDQSTGSVSRRGMHDDPRLLVDHEKVLVLVHDRQRKIFGDDIHRRRGRDLNIDDIPRLKDFRLARPSTCLLYTSDAADE